MQRYAFFVYHGVNTYGRGVFSLSKGTFDGSMPREVLEYYHVENNLNKHLSALSEYKIPKMEDIYETA